MLHFLAVAMVLVVVGLSVGFYLLRDKLTQKGRLVMVSTLVAVIGLGAWLASKDYSQTEPVWQQGSIQWEHMPLRLSWDRSQYSDYNSTIEHAVKVWNHEVGCPVFEIVHQGVTADVTIKPLDTVVCGGDTTTAVQVPESPNAAASAWYCPNHTLVDIQTRRLDAIQLAYAIFLHELGHALGLAHDPAGIMARQLHEDALPTLLLPSDKDAAALRNRYCR